MLAEFDKEDIIEIDEAKITYLKKMAMQSPLKRYRICLHNSPEDLIQEMVIVLHRDTYVRPHRHPQNKTESYHLISGEMDVLLFDEQGNVERRIAMREPPSTATRMYKLKASLWHMPIPLSEFVIYHEVFSGPFDKEKDVEYASWSPEESDLPGVNVFVSQFT